MKKLLVGVVLAVVITGVVVASLVGTGESGTAVEAQTPERRTVARIVKASGFVEPASKVDVSTKVGGEIVALPVREGQQVVAGEVLVEIERQVYQATVEQAVALLAQADVGIRRAEVQLEDARRTWTQTQQVYERQATSRQALDQAKLRLDVAEVELESARHLLTQRRYALSSAREDLGRTTIHSPLAGEVIRLEVEKGETVVPGTMNLPGSVLLTVADMSALLAVVEVNEVDVPHLTVGQQAEVRLDALGERVLPGRVEEIARSGTRDPQLGVVRFPVKVRILEEEAAVRPAMTAKVSIYTEVHEDVLALPIQAVVRRPLDAQGKVLEGEAAKKVEPTQAVFVVREGAARLTPVETGISDALWVEVKEGISEDDRVVVGPYRLLKKLEDGEAVDPDRAVEAEAGSAD